MKYFAIMAHQSAGGFPSGDPSKDGPVNKRPVRVSSEKGNPQPTRRNAGQTAIDFLAAPSQGAAGEFSQWAPQQRGANYQTTIS